MARRRSLIALLVAEISSTTGSQMTWLALPWFVLTTTGSPARMGFVMATELAGLALFGIPSGALAQRLGARRTMLVCDLARAPLLAAVPALHLAGVLTFPLLLGLVFVLGLFFAPYFASQRAILPELLGEDERAVGQGNALLQAATRLPILVGPAVAGVLIGWIGATAVLFVDAATYVISFALLAGFVRLPGRPPPARADRGLFDGARYLARDRLLRPLTASMMVTETAFQALVAALPVLVVIRYGGDARVAGLLFAAWGGGALAGSLLSWAAVRLVDALSLASYAKLAHALPLWLLVLELPEVAVAGTLVASGLFSGLMNAPAQTVATLRIPPSLRSATMTAQVTLIMLAGPLGLAGAGPALEAYGLAPVFLAVALLATTGAVTFAAAALRYRRSTPFRAESAARA